MPNTSPNMNLIVPVPSNGTTGTGDPGPLYAQEISNDLLVTIDQHDHSFGKGVQISPAGININTDLAINQNNLNSVRSSRYASQASSLNGVGDVSSIYVVNGNLYYNNSSGQAVQLTNGSQIVNAESNDVLAYQAVSAAWTILSSDTYIWLNVDTTASRSIQLPAANGVAQGRWYVIADATGQGATNNITVSANGSDTIVGSASITIATNGGWLILGSNGNNAWSILSYSQTIPNAPLSTNYFSAGVQGSTALAYAHVASGLGGAQGQLVQWNNPILQIGDIYQATAVGTGAGWIYFNRAGIYEIDYCIVATGITIGYTAGTNVQFYVHQELNSPNYVGQGSAVVQSFAVCNTIVPSLGGLPDPYMSPTVSYIMGVPSGASLETWIIPSLGGPANPTGVQISPTGTHITIKQIA